MDSETNVGTVATAAGLGTFPTIVFALIIVMLVVTSIAKFKTGQPGMGLMWLSVATVAVYLYLAAIRMDGVGATVVMLALALLLFVSGAFKHRLPGSAVRLFLKTADRLREKEARSASSAPAVK